MKKLTVILIILVLLAVLGLILFSLRFTQIPEKGIEKVFPPKRQRVMPVEPPVRKLVPQRPEDYGMVVTEGGNGSVTQQQWNALMKGKVKELKTEYPPEIWDKVREKIKEDPAVTAQKIAKIDESIKKCREILEKEPDNMKTKQKLERLMILRSIGEDLPSRNN